ncbi:SRPBCC domain-containing protein [Psychrobacillus vulpis]|uniref:PDZ domain-containing protein n=1 Tax=Psychrobacillus vulpis TaxID=2325572 RepID=A0A544TSN0_9BACI|nr:SRPBCC domain-containing protein [Psychrobacillus vulpis]TQR20453.1 PDZ domain-containing protein [Psychrobacillus vulpis]
MEKVINSVQREIFVKASPERIWKALTISEERNKWETKSCELDIRIGGQVSLDYGWGVSYIGTIVELEEHKKLVLKREDDDDLTIWTITPQDKGSLVSIEYTGSWVGDIGMMEMDNMLFGTYQFMLNLKSIYEEGIDIRSKFWRSWIGILHRTYKMGEVLGSRVVKVQPNTPADSHIQVGDMITKVNGTATHSYDDVEKIISELGADKEVTIEINRNGLPLLLTLKTIPFGQMNSQ